MIKQLCHLGKPTSILLEERWDGVSGVYAVEAAGFTVAAPCDCIPCRSGR